MHCIEVYFKTTTIEIVTLVLDLGFGPSLPPLNKTYTFISTLYIFVTFCLIINACKTWHDMPHNKSETYTFTECILLEIQFYQMGKQQVY